MDSYDKMEPMERDPCCVSGTFIFMDKLFSGTHIPQPDSCDDDDFPIPTMENYFEEVGNHRID